MSPAEEPSQGAHYVKSAEKTLAVLLAFTAETPYRTVTEVAAATQLTRAAARRFLLTLVDLGYLSTEGSHFALTPRVLDIGAGFLAGLDLPKVAQPHLNDLAHDLDESATLSTSTPTTSSISRGPQRPDFMRSPSIWETGSLPGPRPWGGCSSPSSPESFQEQFLARVEISPFTDHTVSSAHELGQELNRIRKQGWCLVSQELDDGLRGLAVPIRRGGNTLAALNVSLHTSHLRGLSVEDDLVPRLQRVAASIAEDFGGRAD